VRCAACKHSWHQDPEATAGGEAEPEAVEQAAPEAPPAEPTEDESLAEATLIEPRSGPEAEERAYEEAALEEADRTAGEAGEDIATAPGADSQFDVEPAAAECDFGEPPQAEAQDDEFTPFPAPDEVEPERRSPLALVTTHMDRQRLESGNELLTVTGRVINPTSEEQDVPPLQAQLRARGGKVVYSWTIAPPARTLAPGASASFNSAEVNVPPGGEELTITVGSPKA
jgi:hypothetical protein